MIPKGARSLSEWVIEMSRYNAATHIRYRFEALIAREIGSDNTAPRTVSIVVASRSAGRPALTFGYVPIKKGALQMTTASLRLAKSIHALPPVTYDDSCIWVHYDNDVNPGFHYYEAEGTALNIPDIGSAHSRIIKCLKSIKPQA
eukprot:6273217-Pyramimonas_sp.AAC.1